LKTETPSGTINGVNKVFILGRLTRDPETKELNGTTVTKFSVATSEKWKDKSGGQKEDVQYHNVECWNKLGQLCGEYLSKGKQVWLEGKLKTDQWEKSGEKRYSTKVVALSVQFLGGKSDNNGEGGTNDSDEIPF